VTTGLDAPPAGCEFDFSGIDGFVPWAAKELLFGKEKAYRCPWLSLARASRPLKKLELDNGAEMPSSSDGDVTKFP
jgi:hypothetical protein